MYLIVWFGLGVCVMPVILFLFPGSTTRLKLENKYSSSNGTTKESEYLNLTYSPILLFKNSNGRQALCHGACRFHSNKIVKKKLKHEFLTCNIFFPRVIFIVVFLYMTPRWKKFPTMYLNLLCVRHGTEIMAIYQQGQFITMPSWSGGRLEFLPNAGLKLIGLDGSYSGRPKYSVEIHGMNSSGPYTETAETSVYFSHAGMYFWCLY